MNSRTYCTSCRKASVSILDFRCSSCGKPLDFKLDLGFEPRKVQLKDHSAWRYTRFFPYVYAEDIVTLGEGWTPLVKFTGNLHFKLENLNPTGSFKDRGSTTLISALHKQVRK